MSGSVIKEIDKHISLAPLVAEAEKWTPGIFQPIFQFNLLPEVKGGREIFNRTDGRDGLTGGANIDGLDFRFTHASPGASPYTVDVTRANSCWSLSTTWWVTRGKFRSHRRPDPTPPR